MRSQTTCMFSLTFREYAWHFVFNPTKTLKEKRKKKKSVIVMDDLCITSLLVPKKTVIIFLWCVLCMVCDLWCSEQTKVLLTNAACVHLKQLQYSKFTRNLSPASRTILLSGPQGVLSFYIYVYLYEVLFYWKICVCVLEIWIMRAPIDIFKTTCVCVVKVIFQITTILDKLLD